MKYVGEPVWLERYGGKGLEGFGGMEGTVTGPKLSGALRWANHARRREDGVWCPDLHGVVTTEDGTKVLINMEGYNAVEKVPSVRSAITAMCTFGSADARYRWPNAVRAIQEGLGERPAARGRTQHSAPPNALPS